MSRNRLKILPKNILDLSKIRLESRVFEFVFNKKFKEEKNYSILFLKKITLEKTLDSNF